MPDSLSHDPLGRSRTEIDVEVTMAALILLTALSGNLLVVYVISRDSRLHNITNIFIHNLALTDVAMATTGMPFWIASLYSGTWKLGQLWCQVVVSILWILSQASIFTIGMIAFNRYIKVVKPTQYRKLFPSKRAARSYCVLVWLVPIFLKTPHFFGWLGVSFTKFLLCLPEPGVYLLIVSGVLINGVTTTIFFCNFKIYKAVKQSTGNLNAHAEGNGVRAANDSRRSNMTDVRVLKTCFTVACVYMLIWSPLSIITVGWISGFYIPQTVFTASVYMGFLSCMVNPFIYGIMNPQFRLAFKRALSCGCYGNESTAQNHPRNVVRREIVRGWEAAA